MNARIASIKAHFANWRQWELNPVVVKELRQAVRSWAVTGMLLLFLAVLFFTALGFLVGQSLQANQSSQIGGAVFSSFVVILTVASMVFIPLYVGIRLALERQESNLDLLYVTTLSPARIIRGKFLCGVYMAILFFSACMPFMVFTNLLRGVDLPTILFILSSLFLVVCSAIQVAIFLACLPISKVLKVLVALFGVFAALSTTGPLSFFLVQMMFSGVGSTIGAPGFWAGFATAWGIVLAAVLLLYFLSVAMISPVSANRALPLRSYITLIWLLGAVLCFLWARKEADMRVMLPWAIFSFILLNVALLVVISNYDELSPRVRRAIPVSPIKRLLAFLFYNGAAGGLVWVVSLMAATWGSVSLCLRLAPSGFSNLSTRERFEFETVTATALMYALAYALIALFLHRRFLSRRSPKIAGILAILLPSAWALIPYIAFFFLNRLNWRMVDRLHLGNIFNLVNLSDDSNRQAHLLFAAALLLGLLLLNAKWFVTQCRRFKPVETTAAPPIITTSAAQIPAAGPQT